MPVAERTVGPACYGSRTAPHPREGAMTTEKYPALPLTAAQHRAESLRYIELSIGHQADADACSVRADLHALVARVLDEIEESDR